jgi:transposase
VRTWAPKGQTPVIQYNFNWKHLSVVAGVSFWNFYFRLYPGSIKGPQLVEFLGHLHRHIGKPLLVIWNGLPAHRGRVVQEFLDFMEGAIQVERLPACAPELNPVEYLFGHLKQHELANFCPKDFRQLSVYARKRLGAMRQRRSRLVTAFWQQAELALRMRHVFTKDSIKACSRRR